MLQVIVQFHSQPLALLLLCKIQFSCQSPELLGAFRDACFEVSCQIGQGFLSAFPFDDLPQQVGFISQARFRDRDDELVALSSRSLST